ncbi:hypothetical protein HDN1F_24320 [gamma proteobacterium HdN1]|nr:hypothetical protein HDN1F_24320 [gamma proteobacterium HdN1]
MIIILNNRLPTMEFLCTSHLEQVTRLSDDQLSQTWLHWMVESGVQYECGNWRRALPFAGSAFDLARLRLERTPPCLEPITQLALAGIYSANIFDHLCLLPEASHIRRLASEYLAELQHKLTIPIRAECSTCRRYLHDLDRQRYYVQHFLNIPFERPHVAERLAHLQIH